MTYQGHKNYAYWNVSLWIGNDERLYQLAKQSLGMFMSKNTSARWVLEQLHSNGIWATPDGVRYNKANILAALHNL